MSSRADARDLTPSDWITLLPLVRKDFDCKILHFVQDDTALGGVMHNVVLKWNDQR